jgi:hypothetical protein
MATRTSRRKAGSVPSALYGPCSQTDVEDDHPGGFTIKNRAVADVLDVPAQVVRLERPDDDEAAKATLWDRKWRTHLVRMASLHRAHQIHAWLGVQHSIVLWSVACILPAAHACFCCILNRKMEAATWEPWGVRAASPSAASCTSSF